MIKTILDLNGDGKIDGDDAERGFEKVIIVFVLGISRQAKLYMQISKVLGYSMPSGGGFTVGLILGLKN